MSDFISYAIPAAAIGIGATVIMDLWALIQRRLLGAPSLDYRLVGRWLAYLARGQWRHPPVPTLPAVRGEAAIGWTAHYAIGVAFAGGLLAVWGPGWACSPSLEPALIVGMVTVLAPFLILQPALGAGVAASRTPRPNLARLRSLMTHLVFGGGLFVAAEAWSWLA